MGSQKKFGVDVILTGITARMCSTFPEFHEAADVLFPGITNIGLAYMHKEIAAAFIGQCPTVAAYLSANPAPESDDLDEFLRWRDKARQDNPGEFTLSGPVVVAESTVEENCRKFFDGVAKRREEASAEPLEVIPVVVG